MKGYSMQERLKNRGNQLVRLWKRQPLFSTAMALLLMVVVQTIALGFDYPSFGEWLVAWGRNWINILRNNAGVGIVALGMTFVIISGGIDLAVGSTLVAVGAVVMALIDEGPYGLLRQIGISGVPAYAIAILTALLMGTALGAGTGYLVANRRLPPFIATLGMMKILRSVTQQYTQRSSPSVPMDFLKISNLRIGGEIILPIVYWLLLAALLHFVSRHTVFGRQVYAIGSNERASRLSGIHVRRVKRMVYALMGMLVSVASIIQIARIGSMDYANAGSGYEMDAIAAVIIGGTSMSGGRGSIIGTVLGMLILAVMNNLLNLMGVPPFLREAFKGLIVILAVLLQKKDDRNS
ncbi:MAG: ABC transporter permease [Christensenellales bacterium]|jgi:ribose transport system permease protein